MTRSEPIVPDNMSVQQKSVVTGNKLKDILKECVCFAQDATEEFSGLCPICRGKNRDCQLFAPDNMEAQDGDDDEGKEVDIHAAVFNEMKKILTGVKLTFSVDDNTFEIDLGEQAVIGYRRIDPLDICMEMSVLWELFVEQKPTGNEFGSLVFPTILVRSADLDFYELSRRDRNELVERYTDALEEAGDLLNERVDYRLEVTPEELIGDLPGVVKDETIFITEIFDYKLFFRVQERIYQYLADLEECLLWGETNRTDEPRYFCSDMSQIKRQTRAELRAVMLDLRERLLKEGWL